MRITGESANLNVKSRQKGTTRLEYEYPIALADAEEMMEQLVEPGAIEKRRHLIPDGGLVWEIDEFFGENAGLIVAEIELQSADQPIPSPAWLGAEVTDDERYYNVYLSHHPFASWASGRRANHESFVDRPRRNVPDVTRT